MPTHITLFVIILTAVLLWGRYLYIKTLKNSENRTEAINKIAEFAIYIPLGLQAIFLFCYAILKVIPLNAKLLHQFKALLRKEQGFDFMDFTALKIIYLGTLILVSNYIALKVFHSSKNTLAVILYKLFFFTCSVFFLRILVLNINSSIYATDALKFSYNNTYLFIPCIILVFLFAILNGAWIHKQQNLYLKYFGLASRILLMYTSLILFISLVRLGVYAIFTQ